ncbi:MAG: hypothetical protein HYU39_09330 [Thaumarchaeota archaeon]|nr:hypothetical protein [Nitrososphaerota archaeon]
MSQTELMKELAEILKLRREDPSTVLAKAIRVGLKELLRQTAVDDYLRKKISREEAVRLAGLDIVKRAEKERRSVIKDVKWGLGA